MNQHIERKRESRFYWKAGDNINHIWRQTFYTKKVHTIRQLAPRVYIFCGTHEDQLDIFSEFHVADVCVSLVSEGGVGLRDKIGNKTFNNFYNCKNVKKFYFISTWFKIIIL